MRTRPVLHEAENKAKTYEAEATKFGLEAVLASRISIIIIIIIIIILFLFIFIFLNNFYLPSVVKIQRVKSYKNL